MKFNLNINEQTALRNCYTQLDGVGEGAARVPYKLGSARRSVVKNLAALSASLESFEKARIALVEEMWPGLPPGMGIKRDSDPDKYDAYSREASKMVEIKEDIELLPIAANVLYADGNEISAVVLSILERFKLIEGE